MPADQALERVRRLVAVARRIADPEDALGRQARAELPASTRLTTEGVELALELALEIDPSDDELARLIGSVEPAPRAHVLLASNVFVAAHRALALALAQSPRVEVRSSRREPVMARLFAAAMNGAVRVAEELAPAPGDSVWAYGGDRTIETLARELPAGVVLHAYGSGMGVAVFEARGEGTLARAAGGLALDVALFDQRGCLSPRMAIVVGGADVARDFATCVARELAELEQRVPRGALSREETADVVRYRDAMEYAAEILPAGKGRVSVDASGERVVLPPVGRHLHVLRTDDVARVLAPLAPSVAALGVDVSPELEAALRTALPGARVSPLGRMQRPAFDGPADLRKSLSGDVL
jgi:Acyl-CoA reductase (LuxC)